MIDVIRFCDVIDNCEDCPRYGDDCDGDKRVKHTDLISRADAIKAVASITMSIHLSEVICDKLSALPSAEAVSREEYEDIIKDYRKQYENMNNEIADLEAKLSAVQEWIPCSERVPSDINEVLACIDGGWVDIAKYNIGREEWYVIGKGEKNIIAWMPLPKPYREDGDKE